MEAQDSKLLPCPFCGAGSAGVYEDAGRYFGFEWSVNCTVCNGSSGEHENEAAAVAAWNRRAQPVARAPLNDDECLGLFYAAGDSIGTPYGFREHVHGITQERT